MKNLNNKTLIIILGGLVVVFVLARIFRSPKLESNLPGSIVAVDTAKADVIRITPSDGGETVALRRKDGRWFLQKGERDLIVDQASVRSMLAYLAKMAPQRMVTRKSSKWGTYQVGDTTTRVAVLKGDDELATVLIGRTAFSPSPGDPQNPFGGGFGGAFTYVRLDGADEVYTVEGFLEPTFNKKSDDWRDKSVLRIKSGDIARIRFNYPDSGFVVEKKNGKWMLNDTDADSVKVTGYLGLLEYKNASGFDDAFTIPPAKPVIVEFESSKGGKTVVQGWRRGQDGVIASSFREGTFFTTDLAGFNSLFERRENFVKR